MQLLTAIRPKFASFFCRAWLSALFFLAVLSASARAGLLGVGEAVPIFAAQDQFGKEFKFAPGLHFLLVGFDMNAGKLANHKLADLGAGWLENHGVASVLDIHTMPAIARLFALPKMQKYPHRIILAETAALLAPFPHQPEKITILELTPAGSIRAISFWDPNVANPILGATMRPWAGWAFLRFSGPSAKNLKNLFDL